MQAFRCFQFLLHVLVHVPEAARLSLWASSDTLNVSQGMHTVWTNFASSAYRPSFPLALPCACAQACIGLLSRSVQGWYPWLPSHHHHLLQWRPWWQFFGCMLWVEGQKSGWAGIPQKPGLGRSSRLIQCQVMPGLGFLQRIGFGCSGRLSAATAGVDSWHACPHAVSRS